MSLYLGEFYNINGELENTEEKLKEVLDKGKLVYEVIRIIDGYPLFFKEHMERLYNSCELVNIKPPITSEEVFRSIRDLCSKSTVRFGNIKLVINSESLKYVLYFIPHYYPEDFEYEEGVKTILYYGERNNPNAKVVDYNFRENIDKEIKKTKAYEAILINNEGNITEGSKSNIFVIKNNKVITAPLDAVLPGITRLKIIEVIKELGISFEERYVSEKEIKDLSGLFISGTSPKVLPIKEVENFIFNSKDENIVKIRKAFDKIIEKDIKDIKNNSFK
ncbi:aminotransferase class IV [Hathewaya massiliensis]|uniref:aminotransferase class IV n=1 Tax=Hathewaya massiliensis TaxID=1964382 RepID=UPI001FAA1B7B|nr:aminotransferase class IV [Hathewaya massiliensis]